jgi:hypothetical protein
VIDLKRAIKQGGGDYILTINSLSNMLFLAVEQKYLHGWKAGDAPKNTYPHLKPPFS